MPGFFDFSDPFGAMNPDANSPLMDETEQAGSYDFNANLPQEMPQQPSQGVPYNALAAMGGIEMPQMPQQDAMGRYGVTDEQYGDAGRQSLASILRGAAGTMFNDRPDDVLKAAAGSGDIRRGALDKASLENVNAFKLQVEAKAKELDFISKKSDIQKQQMQMEAEAMKLEDLKLKRQVAIQWGKEMAPVMSNTLKKTAAMYGQEKADSTKAGFLNAQAKLALGDIDGATMVYEATIKDLPFEWQKQAHEDMLKATQLAANKVGIGLETAKLPDFVAAVTAAEGRIDIGDDAMPKVVTKSEIEIENLRKQALQEQIASERARQASYAGSGGGAKGTLTEKQVNDYLNKATTGANEVLRLSNPTGVMEEKDRAKNEKALSEARGDLAPFGLSDATPEQIQQFLSLDPRSQSQMLFTNKRGGGAAAPQGGAPVVQGGVGQVAEDPIALFKQAVGGSTEQKGAALVAMSKLPATAKMVNDVKKLLGLTGRPKDAKQAADWTNLLFSSVAASQAGRL